MIVDAILGAFRSLVEWLVGLIPTVGNPPDVSATVASLEPLWGYFSYVNRYVPLQEILTMAVVLFGFKMAVWIVRFGLWLWGMLPFGGNGLVS